jgi:hypothetical protein
MIYRVRTMTLLTEQAAAVRAVALRAAAHVNACYPGIRVEVLENVAGRRDQIHMLTACSSLAALEAYEAQRAADREWNALAEAAEALHGIHSMVDNIYRVLTPPAGADAGTDTLCEPFDLRHIPVDTTFVEDIES